MRLNSLKITYKCFKKAVQSITFSCLYWLVLQIFRQIESIKSVNLPRLQQKKILNLSHLIGGMISALSFCLYYCHQNKTYSFRKVTAKKLDYFLKKQMGQKDLYTAKWSYSSLYKTYLCICWEHWLWGVFLKVCCDYSSLGFLILWLSWKSVADHF